jgi:hypothetical protein
MFLQMELFSFWKEIEIIGKFKAKPVDTKHTVHFF